MGIDFKKCDIAAGRIYLEACKLLASDGGLRTAEGMLTGILESSSVDWPRGYQEAEEEDRAAVVTLAFFWRLKYAVEKCGHHLGMHLMLEKHLQTASRSAEAKPLKTGLAPYGTDPEAIRKRDLDQHRLLTIAEVAYILQCTERRVQTAVKRKKLKCAELGKRAPQWRFRPADVDRYIAKCVGDEPYSWRQL